MELIALDVEAFHLGVADFDALVVGSRVECAFDLETGFGRGCGDQCDDSQPIRERSAAPVLRDVAEAASSSSSFPRLRRCTATAKGADQRG
jgi:hypothetical protein